MTETSSRLANLRSWNIGVGGLHLVQGALILILSIMDSPRLTLGALSLVVGALIVRLRFKGQLQ